MVLKQFYHLFGDEMARLNNEGIGPGQYYTFVPHFEVKHVTVHLHY